MRNLLTQTAAKKLSKPALTTADEDMRKRIADKLNQSIVNKMTLEQNKNTGDTLQNTLRLRAYIPMGGLYFLTLIQTASTTVSARLWKVNTSTDEIDAVDNESITSIGEVVYWDYNPLNPRQIMIMGTNEKGALITVDIGAETITVDKETTARFATSSNFTEFGCCLLFHNGGVIGATLYSDSGDMKLDVVWWTIDGTTLTYQDNAVSSSAVGSITATWRGLDIVYDETESAYVAYGQADNDTAAFKFTIASDTITHDANANGTLTTPGSGSRIRAQQGYGILENFPGGSSYGKMQAIIVPDFSGGTLDIEDATQNYSDMSQGQSYWGNNAIHGKHGLAFYGQDKNFPITVGSVSTSDSLIRVVDALRGYSLGDATAAMGQTLYGKEHVLFTEDLDYLILVSQYNSPLYMYADLYKFP